MKNKNIVLNKLKQGYKILLETKEFVFEIEIVNPDNGSVLISGGKRFLTPTQATIVGAYGRRKIEDKDELLEKLQIEQHVGVEIQYSDIVGRVSDFITSPVLSAKVIGPDWAFEMWDSNDIALKLAKSLDDAKARVRLPEKKNKAKDEDDNQDEDSVS